VRFECDSILRDTTLHSLQQTTGEEDD